MDTGEVAAPVCPRCGDFIPNNESPGAYPGALSRTDNYTEVCSECGSLEAMEQFRGIERLSGTAQQWWSSQREAAWHAGRLKK